MDGLHARALACLNTTFGHSAFRGKQWEAIQAICSRRDTLVLMPTGGGKTMCYAVPALLLPGLALVVSPLIALVQDQVRGLTAAGVRAAFLNSSQSAAERDAVKAAVLSSDSAVKLLFVTPELLVSDRGQSLLKRLTEQSRVSFLAVDEAHCISTWGHDFRAAYRKLDRVRRQLTDGAGRRVPVLALTATASPEVRKDIAASLQFAGGLELVSSLNRANIQYSCRYVGSDADHEQRSQLLLELLAPPQRGAPWPCAIIYALKRADVDLIAERLRRAGVPAGAYHAGLKDRAQVLEDFLANRTPVIAATVAFGLGVDKPDVRHVIHYNVPKSIAAFYQESGRAGRDGQFSRSVMFVTHEDLSLLAFLAAKEDGDSKARADKRSAGSGRPPAAHVPQAEAKLAEVRAWCLNGGRCRRILLLECLGEQRGPCNTTPGNAPCDVCQDAVKVGSALAEFQNNPPPRRWQTQGHDADEDVNAHCLSWGDLDYDDFADPYGDCEREEAPRPKRKRRADDGDRDGKLRERLAAGDLSSDDDAPVRVKSAPKDVTPAHRSGVCAKLATALAAAASALQLPCARVDAFAQQLDDLIFRESISKAGYFGRARSVAAHVTSSCTLEKLSACSEPGVGQLLEQFASQARGSEASQAAAAAAEETQAAVPSAVADKLSQLCSTLERTLQPAHTSAGDADAACALLLQLQTTPVTSELLKQVPVAKRVKAFAKHYNVRIAAAAASVIAEWKTAILQQQ